MNENTTALAIESRRNQADAYRRLFDDGLAKLRHEFLSNLCGLEVDLLDPASVENACRLFESRLQVAQRDFLAQLSVARDALDLHSTLPATESGWMPETLGGLAAGGGAAAAMLWPVVPTTMGHLWWKKIILTPVVAPLAGLLGLPVAVVGGGIGVLAAVATGFVIRNRLQDARRREIREKLLATLDNDLFPRLRQWARSAIARALAAA